MQDKISKNVNTLLDTLQKAGYEAYIVGGCVRDILLGLVPHDFDVTTNAKPEEVKRLFNHTADTGLKHGTVTVIIDGEPIEVTTFRRESRYNDNRHPESVDFVNTVDADLARRDFTVNAMAYCQKTGLVDLFDGREDLKAHILRAVGEPKERFSEDALRILRLFRFASTLKFTPEESTLKAALYTKSGLEKISVERIFDELFKLVCGEYPQAVYPLLKNGGLEYLGLFDGDLKKILKLPPEKIRFFAFLDICSKDYEKTLSNFKISNTLKKYCLDMKELSCKNLPDTKYEIKKLLNLYGDTVNDFLILKSANGESTEKAKMLLKEIKEKGEPYKISHMKIDGDDLKALGITGVKTGEVLNKLLDIVMKEPKKNERETLINLI